MVLFCFIALCCHNPLKAQSYTLTFLTYETQTEVEFRYQSLFSSEIERRKEINNVLLEFYNKGYLGASVDSVSQDSLHKTVFLNLGKRFKWAYINTAHIDNRLLSVARLDASVFENRPVNIAEVHVFMTKLLTYLENNGYPFARIFMDSIVFSEENVKAALVLEKGPPIHYAAYKIEGTASVTKAFLRNYLGIKEGDLYSEKKVRSIDKNLEDLNFMRLRKGTRVSFYDTLCVLHIFADERNASHFDGVLGIAPDEITGKIVLTGDIKLNLNNAFGHAEDLSLNWRRFQDNSQRMHLGFSYPYLFSTPLGVDYAIDMMRKDTTYVTINQNAGLRYYLGRFDYLRFFADIRRSYLLQEPPNLNSLSNYADIDEVLFGMSWHKEAYNYRQTPTRGYGFQTSIAGGQREIKPHPAVSTEAYQDISLKDRQYRLSAQSRFYLMPFQRHVLHFKIDGAYMAGAHLFENEMYRIGGLNMLRGFDEESIYAAHYAIVTGEYRFMLERHSFINLFWNGAYYENNNVLGRVIDRPYGFGAGFTFETRQGLFSVNYALGKQFDNPIIFRNAKIHFGYVNNF